MRMRYPLELEMVPKQIDTGTRWVTLRVKNIGKKNLRNLDVRLNSRDTYFLRPLSPSKFIFELPPGEEEWLSYQITAEGTASLYATVDGYEEDKFFAYESPDITLKVIGQLAEVQSLVAITEPYPPLGETLRCDANIIALENTDELNLEFWVDTPSGEFKNLADIETKELEVGEEATYSAEVTPKDTGIYTIHAYLYYNDTRIDHETDVLHVKK